MYNTRKCRLFIKGITPLVARSLHHITHRNAAISLLPYKQICKYANITNEGRTRLLHHFTSLFFVNKFNISTDNQNYVDGGSHGDIVETKYRNRKKNEEYVAINTELDLHDDAIDRKYQDKKNEEYLKSIVKYKDNDMERDETNRLQNTSELSSREIDRITQPTDHSLEESEHKPQKYTVKDVYNFASLVNKSETLQKLVKLGVDLSKVESTEAAGNNTNMLVSLEFEKDIQPKLLFLKDLGLADSELGPCLTRNPLLLAENIEELQKIVDYFHSKKFASESLMRIVTKVPQVFTMDVEDVDKALGQYQRMFRLKGEEVRAVITRLPKLIIWPPARVKAIRFYMGEFLGFSNIEQKRILLECPKVYLSNEHQLGVRFDYLHNTMGIPHTQLVNHPGALCTRPHILKQRHKYLQHLSRAQYDPKHENYVSLQALVMGRDREFCENVAKTSLASMDEFCKTL